MAKATGKLISATRVENMSRMNATTTRSPEHYAYIGDTVTIELPKGMKVIGKREDCKGYSKGSSNFWTRCKTYQEFVASRYCPCHSWKPKKGARG